MKTFKMLIRKSMICITFSVYTIHRTQQYDELYKQHLQLQEQSEELENTLKFLLENYKPFNYEEFIQHHPL